jgi:hypothetical protein
MIIYIDEDFDSLISPLLSNYRGKKVSISEFGSIDFKSLEGGINWHFWLDLNNAKELQKQLAAIIIQAFPEIKHPFHCRPAEPGRSTHISIGFRSQSYSALGRMPNACGNLPNIQAHRNRF